MAFYEEIKNKVVSDIIDTIQCNLTSFIQEKIKSDKYSQYNNIDEDFLPAPMISMNYLKKFYVDSNRVQRGQGFKLEDIPDAEIIKYFCITEYLYPVFYFTTSLNKSCNYNNNISYNSILVYNNGSLLNINYHRSGNNQGNTYVVDQDKRIKFLIDNGKGIVTNKIIKFLFRTLGIVNHTIKFCNHCKSIFLDESKTIVYPCVININWETIKERGYNYQLCEKQKDENKCNITSKLNNNYNLEVLIVYINNNFYNYDISEDITYNLNKNGSNISVIENMIIELLKDQNAIPEYLRLSEIISDTEKLYTRLQETNNDIKLKLDKEREEFEEYKRSEIEKLKLEKEQFLLSYESEVETIDRLKKEIQNEHSETLKSRKLQLEEDIRKEISNEYKERRELEDKIFREEMDSELRRRIIKFEKESIGIEKEEINCLKLLYESIEENSRNLGKREENIEIITETIIESCSNSCNELKNYIYKGKVYINHSSKLSVIAKYNKTKIEDYIRNYIKDYSDFYLEMISWIDSMSGRTNIICDEIDKLTEGVEEYIED
jgi:hypothetical protein